MKSTFICNLVKRDPLLLHYFKGVYPACVFGEKNGFYILNTDPAHLPGTHWVAYWISDGNIEFFDSGGNPPDFYNLPDCTSYNKVAVQGDMPYCGYYCILYGILKSRNFKMNDIVVEMKQSDTLVAYKTLKHFWIIDKSLH